MPCFGINSSLLKFYTRQHSKAEDTTLHTASLYISSLEWVESFWGVNTFELTDPGKARCGLAFWLVSAVQFVFADCIRNQQLLSVWKSFLCLKSYKQKL